MCIYIYEHTYICVHIYLHIRTTPYPPAQSNAAPEPCGSSSPLAALRAALRSPLFQVREPALTQAQCRQSGFYRKTAPPTRGPLCGKSTLMLGSMPPKGGIFVVGQGAASVKRPTIAKTHTFITEERKYKVSTVHEHHHR